MVIIGQYPAVVNIIEDIFIGILLSIFVFLIGSTIVMITKENYERYARKSVTTKNTYRINYKIIFKNNKIVKGKTKKQAKENLYKILREENTENVDSDCKIIKIKEIL